MSGVSYVPDYGFEKLDQYRLIIDPDENHLIHRKFDPSSPSPSPYDEETISLESVFGIYGTDNGMMEFRPLPLQCGHLIFLNKQV